MLRQPLSKGNWFRSAQYTGRAPTYKRNRILDEPRESAAKITMFSDSPPGGKNGFDWRRFPVLLGRPEYPRYAAELTPLPPAKCILGDLSGLGQIGVLVYK